MFKGAEKFAERGWPIAVYSQEVLAGGANPLWADSEGEEGGVQSVDVHGRSFQQLCDDDVTAL